MRPNRKMVPVENFGADEFKCRCGCGKDVHPILVVCVQALIYQISFIRGRAIRCIVSGPVRCDSRNTAIYKGRNPASYHKGINGINEGTDEPGAASDCVFRELIAGRWETIPKAVVAQYAIESGMFGGVGWQIYPANFTFVHLDIGPVRTF